MIKKISLVFVTIFMLFLAVSCGEKSVQYKVDLMYEDGTSYKSVTVNDDQTLSLDVLSKEGYTFLGWYLGDEKVENTFAPTADTTLIAKFNINQYTYKFVNYDGTVLKEEKVDYGTMVVAPSNPTRPETDEYRYEFSGWDQELKAITGDITYKACFEEIEKEIVPIHEHVVCPECGLCTASDCDGAATDKCVGHETPKHEHVACPKCGRCTSSDCDGTAAERCAGHKEPTPNPITSLNGLKVSILGDSISTFYAAGSSVNSYYGQENRYYYPIYSSTIKTVDKTWWYQLVQNTSMTLGINNSWSGSCAHGSGESAGMSDARINTIDDAGMPDIVIIYLGTNDCASGVSTSDFSSSIKTMINKIKNLGDTEIFITTLGYSAYTGGQYKESTRVSYNAEIRNIAEEYNCGIVPLDEYIVDTSYMFYLGDNLHYNAKGAELLSKIYEKSIKEYFGIEYTGTIEVEHKEALPEGVLGKITATAETGFWTGTNYESNVYFAASSVAEAASFSRSYEITKDKTTNKYYVSEINLSGAMGVVYNCDYVLLISDAHKDNKALLDDLKDVKVGSIVEFDSSNSYPKEIIFKEG